ncbi:tail assembly chaperone [Rhodobacter phage RcCronus]|uniref:Tail assembly chaperone n=3 Tax=Cronusvirus cronus TaxID=2005060 RepID=A0A0K1LM55_9CAUD|nr:tail assembly chaperone [Rhodobacter phage RcRhea]YP_009616302.1 tail assembly chaperone [Rhodobacter phage RcCronus]AKU43255.1 tail assembly chaperone [Rhodobacter phage RcRhea]AKU43300.1 tail assembly chaperone [Rhodobacter phage RcCronus]AKY02678.1 tail assembly chaperone [Rhodobacter phage RcSaxon]
MNAENILETARAHFDKMRGQTVEIPEWGMVGEDAARFDPPTLRVRQRIQSRAGKSEARQMALVVILCLKDKGGKPLFADDAPTLAAMEAEVDPAVVARAAQKVLNLTSETDLGN